MQEVYEFLKQCQTYFLSTLDGDRPRVRPFGTVNLFEGKLYIQTGRNKKVSEQMRKNPHIELCGLLGSHWLRVEATVVEDDRLEAKKSMLEAYPMLQALYKPNDGNTQVFYLKDVTATFCSLKKPPRVVRF